MLFWQKKMNLDWKLMLVDAVKKIIFLYYFLLNACWGIA